jgi:hypothetical protein
MKIGMPGMTSHGVVGGTYRSALRTYVYLCTYTHTFTYTHIRIGMAGMTSHGVVGGTSGGPEGMRAGAYALAEAIHAYLEESGVDGVKIDAQVHTHVCGYLYMYV